MAGYDPAADPVHGSGWNSAARWGGWSWSDPARGEHFRRCSFCGSIHPEDLAAETAGTGTCRTCGQQGWEACFRAQNISDEDHSYDPGGWYASWADRKYGWPHKFYVDVPSRNPEALYAIGCSNSGTSPGDGWVAWADLTRAQRKIVKRDGWSRDDGWILLGTRASHHAKFYTIHLADPAISQDVKDKIQQASGLRFTFTDDGKVGWQRWDAEAASA